MESSDASPPPSPTHRRYTLPDDNGAEGSAESPARGPMEWLLPAVEWTCAQLGGDADDGAGVSAAPVGRIGGRSARQIRVELNSPGAPKDASTLIAQFAVNRLLRAGTPADRRSVERQVQRLFGFENAHAIDALPYVLQTLLVPISDHLLRHQIQQQDDEQMRVAFYRSLLERVCISLRDTEEHEAVIRHLDRLGDLLWTSLRTRLEDLAADRSQLTRAESLVETFVQDCQRRLLRANDGARPEAPAGRSVELNAETPREWEDLPPPADPTALFRAQLRERDSVPDEQITSVVALPVLIPEPPRKQWGAWWRYLSWTGNVFNWTRNAGALAVRTVANKVLVPAVVGLTPAPIARLCMYPRVVTVVRAGRDHSVDGARWVLRATTDLLTGDLFRYRTAEEQIREIWRVADRVLGQNNQDRAAGRARTGLNDDDHTGFSRAQSIAEDRGLRHFDLVSRLKMAQAYLARRLTVRELNDALTPQNRGAGNLTPDYNTLGASLRWLDQAVAQAGVVIESSMRDMAGHLQEVAARRKEIEDNYERFRAQFARVSDLYERLKALPVTRDNERLSRHVDQFDPHGTRAIPLLKGLLGQCRTSRSASAADVDQIQRIEAELETLSQAGKDIAKQRSEVEGLLALESLLENVESVLHGMARGGSLAFYHSNPQVVAGIRTSLQRLMAGKLAPPFDSLLERLPLIADAFYLRATASERMAQILRYGFELPLENEHRQRLLDRLQGSQTLRGLSRTNAEECDLTAYKDYAFAQQIAALKDAQVAAQDQLQQNRRYLDDLSVVRMGQAELQGELRRTFEQIIAQTTAPADQRRLRGELGAYDFGQERDVLKRKIEELRWQHIYSKELKHQGLRTELGQIQQRCQRGMERAFHSLKTNPLITDMGKDFLDAYGNAGDPGIAAAKGNWAYHKAEIATPEERYRQAVAGYKAACTGMHRLKSSSPEHFDDRKEREYKEYLVAKYRAVNMQHGAKAVAQAEAAYLKMDYHSAAALLKQAIMREERAIEAGLVRWYTEKQLESLYRNQNIPQHERVLLQMRRAEVRREVSFQGISTNLPWLYRQLADVRELQGDTGEMADADRQAQLLLGYVKEKHDYDGFFQQRIN